MTAPDLSTHVELEPRRRLLYALAAALLALGAPVGLLVLRLLTADARLSSLDVEWSSHRSTYLYVALSTMVVFTAFGAFAGVQADRLARLATADSLTRVLNRRGLVERLEHEVRRARRHGRPVSLLMIDVDRLKAINDDDGHRAGDRALQFVARTVVESCRAIDAVGRWGGDEFLVLSPDTDSPSAMRLGERIRVAVVSASAPAHLTVSVGVATWIPVEGSDAFAELLQAADRALYAAKAQGRNRVAVAPTSPALRAAAPARG